MAAFGRVSPALADPPTVKSVVLGTNYTKNKIVGETTTFAPTDHKIVCVLRLSGADKNSQYMVRWFAVDLGDQKAFKLNPTNKKDFKIQEFLVPKQRANVFTATLEFRPPTTWPAGSTPPKDWPTGAYRVDWLRDGQPLRSVEFSIKAPSAITAATAQ